MKPSKIKSKVIWQSPYGYKLHEDKFVLDKKPRTYNYFSRDPGYVAILAIDKEKKLILLKNYRYPIKKDLYELPMGYINRGESPLHAAKREFAEETGLKAKTWKKGGEFFVAPGIMNIKCYLFVATNLQKASANLQSDDLIIRSMKTGINKIKEANEPITRIAYFLAKQYLESKTTG